MVPSSMGLTQHPGIRGGFPGCFVRGREKGQRMKGKGTEEKRLFHGAPLATCSEQQ